MMHARLITLPPGVPELHRDVFAMTHYTYWCGLLVHCGFLVLFNRLGLDELVLFNCASVLVYAGTQALSRRGYLDASLLFGGLEVGLHQIYATLILGIDSGFHFFLLVLSFATLLYTHLSVSLRIAMALFPVLVYVTLYAFAIYHPADVKLSPGTLAWIAAGNVSAFSAILLGICYYFVDTAIKARIAAEELARAKTLFLANMSHELRTPLNAVLGFTRIVERSEALTPEDRRNLATIDRSGEHLLELINQVLDMSKLEDGKLTLAENTIDPRAFLDELANLFAPAADRRRLHFRIDLDPALPDAIIVDELKLRQVLINLLNNAIKFTEAGRVELAVRAFPAPAGRRRLRFEVRDTGPGIAPEERAQLFQLFTQASAGRRSGAGTGLGLALSQSLVRLMGGQIVVTSEVGSGSTFAFEIAVRETARAALPAAARVMGLAPGQPSYRLLVVDDNADNRDVLAQLFQRLGFVVETAEDGESGVARWQATPPDLTWMDLQMPGIDGYEATRRIKAIARDLGRSALVVTITASALPGERERALARGCDDFVSKPFRESDLVGVLERLLGAAFVTASPSMTSAGSRSPLQLSGSASAPAGLGLGSSSSGPQGFSWGERLAAVPSGELAPLRAAVDALDLDAAEQAVVVFAPRHPDLAREVRGLLQDYRFDTLAAHLAA